jgi:hypothetical protein
MRNIVIALSVAASLAASLVLWASPSESEARQRIIETAESFQGVPYVYGAESPEAFDCSGLVQYVYAKAADLQIPRNSKGMWEAGKKVEIGDAKPGDIIVFDTVHSGGPSHVAIFKDDGTIIHAVSEGRKTGVIVSVLKGSSFEKTMLGARGFVVSLFPSSAATSAVAAKPVAPAPTKPAEAPAKPTAASTPVTPVASATNRASEIPLAQIGVQVRKPHDVVEDPIPAATGTAIAFTITNATGRDGVFHIAFYKTGATYTILREERVMLRAGASQELSAYTFVQPGIYRLNVKTADNTQMMQRAWKVIDLKAKRG